MTEYSAETRKEQHVQLERLVERVARLHGLKGLSESELVSFGRLYRRAASDLAYARRYGVNSTETQYLNWLVGRAYGYLYATESKGMAGVKRFFAAELPQTLRRHGRLVILSAALFLAPALIGGVLSFLRPDLLEMLNPQLAATIDELAGRHRGGRNWLPADFRPMASSYIMANNIQISFLAFSGGILVCLGTLLVLIQNGLMLGVLSAGIVHTNAAVHFFAFVAPHGVIELPAIVISGAAGLLLGLAVIEPGEYSRMDALKIAGREAAVIMLGVVVFLVVAGIVEGLFSPAMLPPVVKFIAAAVLSVVFWGYIGLAGRKQS